MSAKGTTKSKESEVAEDLNSELEKRDDNRREDERSEQQDLNQGMETGTHDSTGRGINWGPSYRAPGKRAKASKAPEQKK
jgi:hypothetical protein